jgi:hypothetical protein
MAGMRGIPAERRDTTTKNKDRKQQIRDRMQADQVPYTEAARRVDAEKPDPYERERKIRTRMHASRFPMAYAAAEILVDREARGLPAAPEDWRSVWPHMASTYRDNGGIRRIEILDAVTDRVVAKITVPYQDPDELEAGYRADMAEDPAEGRVSGFVLPVMRLGRPDLVLHQLGWESLAAWSEWPDGTWRCAARPFARLHGVRAEPLSPHHLTIGTITVWEHPGARVVADEIIEPVDRHDTRALDRALDKLGYTVDHWEVLPGQARYGAALPGHLAERDWYRRARIRIVKETTVGAVDPATERTFAVGETVTMHQQGREGKEIDRGSWWDSSDIDGAHIIDAGCAEIVEILEDHPPTWKEAALSAAQVTELLSPNHPGAAEAAAAWEAAGLHVSWYSRGDLAIRTPGPEYRMVGIVPSDYWKGGAFTRPYEAVPVDDPGKSHLRRQLGALPLDPVAAAIRVIDCYDLEKRTGAAIEDDDLIHNGVWERASDQDREECGPCEHYDYEAIRAVWQDASSAWLASQGADWSWSMPGTNGTLTVPADKDDEWAEGLWLQAWTRFDEWIDGVMAKLREGRASAPDDDVRPLTAPGGEWVRYVSPRFDDD